MSKTMAQPCNTLFQREKALYDALALNSHFQLHPVWAGSNSHSPEIQALITLQQALQLDVRNPKSLFWQNIHTLLHRSSLHARKIYIGVHAKAQDGDDQETFELYATDTDTLGSVRNFRLRQLCWKGGDSLVEVDGMVKGLIEGVLMARDEWTEAMTNETIARVLSAQQKGAKL